MLQRKAVYEAYFGRSPPVDVSLQREHCLTTVSFWIANTRHKTCIHVDAHEME